MFHVHIQAQTQLNGMHFQLSDLGRHFKFSGYIVDGLELHFKHDKCRPFVYPTSTTVMGGVAHGTHLCLYLILHLYLYLCLDSYLTSVVFAATTTVTRGEEKPAALICFPPLTTFDATEN